VIIAVLVFYWSYSLVRHSRHTQTKAYFSFPPFIVIILVLSRFPLDFDRLNNPITPVSVNFEGHLCVFSLSLSPLFASVRLPAEQLHEVLEAVLSEEVEGSLGGAEVDEQEDEQADGQKRNQHVPAGGQDVVPLGLVRTLMGQLQVALSLMVPGL